MRFLAAVKESSEPHINMSFFINYNPEDILRQANESTLRYENGSLSHLFTVIQSIINFLLSLNLCQTFAMTN